MTTRILGIVALIIIAGGVYFYFTRPETTQGTVQGPVETQNIGKVYTSEEYSISFSYPESYTLTERDGTGSSAPKHTITLVQTSELQTPQRGEGPTSITIELFPNTTNPQFVNEWVRTSTASNFKLSPDKTTAKVIVGGREGLMYRWGGLYTGETTAIAEPNWIYAFSVTFNSESDDIVGDYRSILQTVRFTR